MARTTGALRTAGPASWDGAKSTPSKALPGCRTGPVGPTALFPQIVRRQYGASWHVPGVVVPGSAQGRSAHSSSALHATTVDHGGCVWRARGQPQRPEGTPLPEGYIRPRKIVEDGKGTIIPDDSGHCLLMHWTSERGNVVDPVAYSSGIQNGRIMDTALGKRAYWTRGRVSWTS
eukprot:2820836-Amphidinium_carterae.4